MWKLPLPPLEDAQADLIRALTYANGETIYSPAPAQMAALLDLYATYDEVGGHPSVDLQAQAFTAQFLAAIYGAYDEVQDGRRLATLRDRLKAATPLCPYCGFGEIRDLDHHLPRAIYRALAIYARNLVPCCSACNGKKRAVAGDAPVEQFAHVYFDELPGEAFFVATIDVSAAGGLQTEFAVVPCAGMSDDLHARLQFQFQRLNLNSRYQGQVNLFIMSQQHGIEDAAAGGAESLRAWLMRAYASHSRSHGLNDWRTALLHALAQSNEFCNGGYPWCFGRALPGA